MSNFNPTKETLRKRGYTLTAVGGNSKVWKNEDHVVKVLTHYDHAWLAFVDMVKK